MQITKNIKNIINNKCFNNVIFAICLLVYAIWSFIVIKNRIPYFDEINAWNIAANCRFYELLEVSKHEGHFILWYLLIKPFAQNNIWFPYPMFIINWFFALGAVIILWLKAPFNNFLKMCITFSLPVQMFSVYARCYSIGVLILFVICAFYNSRIKHNLVYAFLIILLANTSIIGSIAAFSFGILYVYELIIQAGQSSNNTKIIETILIFILGLEIALVQIADFSVPWYALDNVYLRSKFIEFFRFWNYLPKDSSILILSFFLLTGFLFFKKYYLPYIFLLMSTGVIVFIGFNVYALECWHYMFLYIFLFCAMWIYLDNYKISTIIQKLYYVFFHILCICLIFFFKYPWHWNGLYIPSLCYIKNNIEFYNNSNIFLYPTDSNIIGIIPSLSNYNISFYDSHGNSYKSSKAYIEQWDENRIDFDRIRQTVQSLKTDKIFLFITKLEPEKRDIEFFLESLKENHTKIKFTLYWETPELTVYKIELLK